jgi:hypothetical protein
MNPMDFETNSGEITVWLEFNLNTAEGSFSEWFNNNLIERAIKWIYDPLQSLINLFDSW